MSKTVIWSWCVVLAALLNKLAQWSHWEINGVEVHIPPTAMLSIVVVGFTFLRTVTTGPLSTKQKIASWILNVLAVVGSILVYVIPVPPPPAETPNLPAVETPAAITSPEAPGAPLAVENPQPLPPAPETVQDASMSILEVIDDASTPRLDGMALLPLCLVPVFARRWRRAMVIFGFLPLPGCACNFQDAANQDAIRRGVCIEEMILDNAQAQVDLFGRVLTPDQVALRRELVNSRKNRLGFDCHGFQAAQPAGRLAVSNQGG